MNVNQGLHRIAQPMWTNPDQVVFACESNFMAGDRVRLAVKKFGGWASRTHEKIT
jgi:hypothetical protein